VRLKIAFTGLRTIGPSSGGVERAVDEISIRLAARGHDVTVFCRGRFNPCPDPVYRGVRLVNLPALYTKHAEAFTHTFLAACRSLTGYDIVHIHGMGPALWAWLPRMGGGKVVVTVHAMDWKRAKWGWWGRAGLRLGERAAVAFPHRTIVVSRALARRYRESYGRDTVYIPNGVAPAERRPLARLKRFGLRGRDYLLFLGRLVPEKGCHLLLEAFRGMTASCKLLVVGETSHTDDYVGRLRELAAADDRVILAGALYGEEKAEAYSNAIGLVFPSQLEGMPIVLLEAMSHQCPVLCSDIEENLEVFQAGGGPERYVACFTRDSAADLRRRLEEFMRHPEIARNRAEAAEAFVQTTYSWDRAVTETEAVYRQLVGHTAALS
jgi:glycosyltransferase involved in cell wall biosynthesis